MSDLAFEERFVGTFIEEGRQPTADQVLVCRAVADSHSHFAEKDLRFQIREKSPDLPKGLVRKTLERMFEAGLVRKIVFTNEKVFYEHVFGHLPHDHLWCIECHKVVEFRDDRIETIHRAVARQHDFHILRHQLQLIGLCNQCKQSAPEYKQEPIAPREQPVMPLAMVPDGTSMRIMDIVGGRGMRRRLSEMGLVKDEQIKVVNNQFAGPFIIEVKGTRLVIEHKLAHHILVSNNVS